jgi:hypothetical protein
MFKFLAVVSIPAMIILVAAMFLGAESNGATLERMAGQDQFISSLLK